MSMIAPISAVSAVPAVSRGADRAPTERSAAEGGPATQQTAATAAGAGATAASRQMGEVVRSSLTAMRDVSREAAKMPENSAADTMKREIASTESQPAGAVYSVKKIAAQAEAEMKVREPTPIEVLKDQQAGGKPGGNVEELNALIEQTSPLAQKTDLAQTRFDVSKQDDALRQMSEQALAEGRARRGTSLTDKPSAQEQMQSQLAAAQAREGAYSTLSLAAVSPERQQGRGRTVRLTM